MSISRWRTHMIPKKQTSDPLPRTQKYTKAQVRKIAVQNKQPSKKTNGYFSGIYSTLSKGCVVSAYAINAEPIRMCESCGDPILKNKVSCASDYRRRRFCSISCSRARITVPKPINEPSTYIKDKAAWSKESTIKEALNMAGVEGEKIALLLKGYELGFKHGAGVKNV